MEEMRKLLESLQKIQLNEYYARGTANGKEFALTYADFPGPGDVATQNPGLGEHEVHAVIAHFEQYGEDDMEGTQSESDGVVVHIDVNGGYQGEETFDGPHGSGFPSDFSEEQEIDEADPAWNVTDEPDSEEMYGEFMDIDVTLDEVIESFARLRNDENYKAMVNGVIDMQQLNALRNELLDQMESLKEITDSMHSYGQTIQQMDKHKKDSYRMSGK